MSRPCALSILIVFLAFPAAAATGTRIRLENASQPGSRVKITFADPARTPARVEVADDGTTELVVEAPSPRLRLRGGSLRTDPLIEALARRQLRESSTAPTLLVMRSAEPPVQFASTGGPLVYDEWESWRGAVAWGSGWCDPSPRGRTWDIPVAREIPRDRWRDEAPRTPSAPRTFSARGVMPRYSGRR